MKSVGPLAKRVGAGLVVICRRYPALVVTPIVWIGGGVWLIAQLPKTAPQVNLQVNPPIAIPSPSNRAAQASPPAALPPSALPLAALPNSAIGPRPILPAPSVAPSPLSPTPVGTTPLPASGIPSGSPRPQGLMNRPSSPIGSHPKSAGPIDKAPIGIAPLAFDAMVTMKVLIVGKVSGLDLSSSTGGRVTDAQGTSLLRLSEGVRVQSSGNQLSWNGQALPPLIFVDPNPGGLLYVNGKPYRGRLLLTSADGALWVVNYIDLQQYLYSVVGSEVSPSWPMAALKAQTVAARSYALYYQLNPANPLFHIGSDEYYQVYSGARTEAPEVIQAVRETLGEYVSQKGGIVESLYAASDDIVSEAFGGQGMSQLGARGFAERGYSYIQILDHYYPGTKVGRIVVGEG